MLVLSFADRYSAELVKNSCASQTCLNEITTYIPKGLEPRFLTWNVSIVAPKRLRQVVGQLAQALEGEGVKEEGNDAPVVGVEDPLVRAEQQPRVVDEAHVVVHRKGDLVKKF